MLLLIILQGCLIIQSQEATLICNFRIANYLGYACIIENLNLTGINQFTITTDNHLDNLTNDDITGFQIINSRLNFIPNEEFDLFHNLDAIWISRNNLNRLEPNILSNHPSLRYLNLRNNRIASIDQNAFDQLPNLTYLDLISNDISILPTGVFKDLINLELLNLSWNLIQTLDGNLLTNNIMIRSMSFRMNMISVIGRQLMDNLNSLEEADFTNNRCINSTFLNINGDPTAILPEFTQCFVN